MFVSYLNEIWADLKVMNKLLKFREHPQISYPKELDFMKKNFNKSKIILDSSLPNVNDEYENNQEKISDKFYI